MFWNFDLLPIGHTVIWKIRPIPPHSMERQLTLLFSCQVVSISPGCSELQHARILCSSLSPWVCSKSCPLSQWCHLTILSSVIPFSCPQSFPKSQSFPVNVLHIRWPKYQGFSFSKSPSNEYSTVLYLRYFLMNWKLIPLS